MTPEGETASWKDRARMEIIHLLLATSDLSSLVLDRGQKVIKALEAAKHVGILVSIVAIAFLAQTFPKRR